MENTLTQITWLDAPGLSKKQNQGLADAIIATVESGDVNPLTAILQLKSIEEVCKKSKEGIKDWALDEAQKYSARSFEYMGAKVDIKELGVKYDYSDCGDVIWESLNQQVESLKVQLSEREAFLKTIKGSTEMVNPDGGEIYTVHPPKKSSTTGLTVSLK